MHEHMSDKVPTRNEVIGRIDWHVLDLRRRTGPRPLGLRRTRADACSFGTREDLAATRTPCTVQALVLPQAPLMADL